MASASSGSTWLFCITSRGSVGADRDDREPVGAGRRRFAHPGAVAPAGVAGEEDIAAWRVRIAKADQSARLRSVPQREPQ